MAFEGWHIAFLHQDFPFSGAEQVTLSVANYLCTHGHKVTILTVSHHQHLYAEGTEQLFDVHLLPQGHVKRSRHIEGAVRNFILCQKVGVLVTYRQLLYAKRLKRQTGVKMVFELHNTPYYEFLDIADKRRESKLKNLFYGCGVERLLRFFYLQKYRRVYGWCDAYGLLCKGYRQQLVNDLALNPLDNKTWVLPNPVRQEEHIVMEKEKVVVYIGRLTHRDKRVDRLLRIWQTARPGMPGWQLKIVGRGKAAGRLKQLSEDLHLQDVSFEGHTSCVKDYYDKAAILCMTSTFEGWPMCIAEGQANGVVPVLFNSYAGAADLVSDSQEGILVQPYDEAAFARQLAALAADEARLAAMRRSVIVKAGSYSLERTGKAWEEMLRHIISTDV